MNAETRQFLLAGEVADLFSHMALWGLARICIDMGLTGVRCWWSDEPEPRALISAETTRQRDAVNNVVTGLDLARAVRRHATLRASDDSWLRQVFVLNPGKPDATVALMAPRTAAPDSKEMWRRLEEASLDVRDGLPSAIDADLLLGLGYRSWWTAEPKGDIRADKGCSVWEMRTRNRGTDLIADRLLPLVREVAEWPEEKIWAGLSGATVDDSTSNSKDDSRTSTGFRLPGPVDSARAWCALWALSLFPVLPDSRDGSASPAYLPLPRGGRAAHALLVPVVTAATSVERLAMLVRSKALVDAAEGGRQTARNPGDQASHLMSRSSARAQLRSWGALGIMQFPVQFVGSASAPERQTLAGSFFRL